MDVDDAIIRAIIQGNKRYGNILSAAEKICKMSRATFDKHLKQLQKNQYVRREINKKIIEYKINQKKIDEILEFNEDKELDKQIKNTKKILEFKGDLFLKKDAKQNLDKIMQHLNQHIDFCLQEQRRMMIMMNLRKFNLTLQKKCKEEFKKYEISFKQTLEIMEKLSPEIRDDYEEFLLLKPQNENGENITKIKKFKTTSLLKKYLKSYRNI